MSPRNLANTSSISFSVRGGTGFSAMTSPSASCESVETPSSIVPSYVLSSDIRRSCSLVARSSTRMSRPVAAGSNVPQWPTFRNPKWRRTRSTTSWEVIPDGLSTNRTPSNGVSCDCIRRNLQPGRHQRFAHGCQHLALNFMRLAGKACARRLAMATATEMAGDRIHIDLRIFGAKTDAELARFAHLFEENRHDDALDGASVVDQAF